MSKLEMLTPQNSAIALIDYQPAMYQGVHAAGHVLELLGRGSKLRP